MLDYAANALAYWPVESLRARFEARCTNQAIDANEELLTKLGLADAEGFWLRVRDNLLAGNCDSSL